MYSIFRELCRDIRVNPIGMEPNDHHSHLWGLVRSPEPLALPQNSIGRYRGDVRPENSPVRFVFQTYSVFRDLCRAIRINPIGLEPNDNHSHLRGSLRSREPLTLHQNYIGSHRGDVRPENCPVGSRHCPAGSVCAIRVCSCKNSPNPTQQRSNPTFYSPIPHPGTRQYQLLLKYVLFIVLVVRTCEKTTENGTKKPFETRFESIELPTILKGKRPRAS
ncbi:hypothetical protein CRG98_015321 [Punica granatum]|uniref:Uncharacterized protein n=1 Tax=Punica granatum TaxID=22663 RepID=A0A2I0K6U6_PUNGR|nr:hypothetical protein CRG98_015321 [Punica granatum]